MTRARMLTLTLALAASSSTAFAQADEAPTPREVYKPVTEIIFEGLDVEGELVGPEMRLLSDVKRGQFMPMIRLRTDFNVEMAESVAEVK